MTHAVIVKMEVSELRVAGLQIEYHVALGLGCAAADLGNLVLEPMRQIDALPVLGSRDRVLDRLAVAPRSRSRPRTWSPSDQCLAPS